MMNLKAVFGATIFLALNEFYACCGIKAKGMVFKMQKIIDFHAHVFPTAIAQKATDNVGNYYGLEMRGNGTASNLLEGAKTLNMQGFVIHSSATKPAQVESVNDFIANYVKENKVFIGFGTIHKEFENIESEMKRMKKIGLIGLKLHPDFQGFNIDDEDMMIIYDCAMKLDIPILFHVGDENSDASSPTRLRHVMDLFPKLTVIAAHMGGYSAWDEAEKVLYGQNVYFDTSSTMMKLSYEKVREMIYMHGVDKILFGSDFPIQFTPQAARDIYNLNLNDEDRNKIFYENAAKLLKIK